jgi:hypothetical protein
MNCPAAHPWTATFVATAIPRDALPRYAPKVPCGRAVAVARSDLQSPLVIAKIAPHRARWARETVQTARAEVLIA